MLTSSDLSRKAVIAVQAHIYDGLYEHLKRAVKELKALQAHSIDSFDIM